MELDRWERLKELFAEALSKEERDREPFLSAACQGDDELRREAMELLRGHKVAADQPSSPALLPSGEDAHPPQFEVGQVAASRYRIVRFIARGGMGEVYEAEDLHLNQRVALKTLRRGLLGTNLVEILKHEIQSARRVTHPNVCRIYDIAEHAESHLTLLTMELLEGPTLFRYLQEHGPLSPAEALPLIEQIAAGLQAAHDAGVVHGDFKTSNVILVGDALQPVITDFGLAQFPGSRPREHAGTPGYMAPEQVKDKAATVATDVYALGVAIAAVIGVEITDRKAQGMGKWKKTLSKCLATEPKERYLRPIDVAGDLRGTLGGYWWKLAGIGALVLFSVLSVCSRPAPEAPRTIQARQLSISDVRSISPDGQWIIRVDRPSNLLLQRISTGETRKLSVGAGGADPSSPVMSADGRSIAFRVYNRDAQRYEIRVRSTEQSGSPRVLASGPPFGMDLVIPVALSPKGDSLLGMRQSLEAVEFVWMSVHDGSMRTIKTLQGRREGTRRIRPPTLSPDGRFIAYAARRRQDSVETPIFILSSDGSQEYLAVEGHINEEPIWTLAGDRLLFTSNRSNTFGLWSVSMRDGQAIGTPAIVKTDTGRIRSLGIGSQGTLYYECQCTPDQVYLAEITSGGPIAPNGKEALVSFVGARPAWSPDGKWLSFQRSRPAEGDGYDLVLRRMEDSKEWSFRKTGGAQPEWSADGVVRSTQFQISVRDGEPKELAPSQGTRFTALAISGNTKLYYKPGHQEGSYGVEVLDARTGNRLRFIRVAAQMTGPILALSPDGTTFAFINGFGRIFTIRTDGTDLRQLYTGKPQAGWQPGQLSFTSDGRNLLFLESSFPEPRIMQISRDGGLPEFTGISARGLTHFSVRPGGSLIAYGVLGQEVELWALDNIATAWERKH